MASQQSPPPSPPPKTLIAPSKYSNRVILKTILGRGDGGVGLASERVVVGGWVKSSREVRKETPPPTAEAAAGGVPEGRDFTCVEILQSRIPLFRSIIKVLGGNPVREKPDLEVQKPPSISILQISDGSCVASLQVLVDSSIAPPTQVTATGTCVLVEGTLEVPAVQGKNVIELRVERIMHVGTVDQGYPLSKKRLPLETFRDFPHFSPRTTTVASVSRIRHALNEATQSFFMNNGFLYVQVPIITTTDSEGFSNKFQVTTLLGSKEESNPKESTQGEEVGSWGELVATLRKTNKMNDQAQGLELAREKPHKSSSDLGKNTRGVVDFSQDFFSCQTYLAVSGRLHLESFARALGSVYTFGPRFRAEKSVSRKQAPEMWMVEAEMAFSSLEDAMNCTEDFLKFMSKWVLENCCEDLAFLQKRVDQTIVNRLESVASSSFQKISYAEAVEVLKQIKEKKLEVFEWGVALTEEHESYLADEIYKSPVIIHHYPKELKPFYARLDNHGKTVATFDLIMPKAGKLIRGSQNEERLSVLTARIKELGLPRKQYEWYLDLRRHGTVTQSGFSLTFDLLVAFASGLIDVKDAIPFPRIPGKANN